MSIASASFTNPLLVDLDRFLAEEAKKPLDLSQQLFHSIASNAKDVLVLAEIKQVVAANASLINKQSKFHGVTPLILAVMKNRYKLTQELLNHRADPNLDDNYGWTPLLHAALATEGIASLILAKGANPNLVSINCVGYSCLRELTACESENKTLARVQLFNEQGELIPTNIKNAKKIMGLKQYRSKARYHLQHVAYLWNNGALQDKVDRDYHKLAMAGCQKGIPIVAVRNDQLALETRCEKAKGLFAGQKISKGQFIGTYSGETTDITACSVLDVLFNNIELSPYQFGVLDAKDVGNETRMINDGMPNLTALNVGFDVYFLALRDIQEGEELLFNYGVGDVQLKWGRYLVKNKEEISQLFGDSYALIFEKDHEYEQLKANSKARTNDFLLERLKFSSTVSFVFFTPQVLIDLIVNKKATVAQIKEFKRLSYIQEVSEFEPDYFIWINELVSYLRHFEQALTKVIDSELLSLIQTTLNSLEGHLNQFQILNVMQNIEKLIQTIASEEQKNKLKEQLPLFLKEADELVIDHFTPSIALFRDIFLDSDSMKDESVFHVNSLRLAKQKLDEYKTVEVAGDTEVIDYHEEEIGDCKESLDS
jgi:hypothetical protein